MARRSLLEAEPQELQDAFFDRKRRRLNTGRATVGGPRYTFDMRTQQLPAGSLRIGQRVVRDGHSLVVSSVRFEGAGGGVVSVEFAGEAGRSTFAPGEVLVVAVSSAA